MNKGNFLNSFVIPLLLGLATLSVGWALATYVDEAPKWAITTAFIIGALLVLVSGWLAFFSDRQADRKIGDGRGGRATVRGSHSRAYGGKGGQGATSQGGDALVEGNNSLARGGDAGPSD